MSKGVKILAGMNKNSYHKNQSSKISQIFTATQSDNCAHFWYSEGGSRLEWNMLEKFHFQRKVTQKNSRIETY
jgi:hypothetical protein